MRSNEHTIEGAERAKEMQLKSAASKKKNILANGVSVKESITLVFEKLGGVNGYAKWAAKNPDKFYEHYLKVLPVELKAEVNVTTDFALILEAARLRGAAPVATIEQGAAVIAEIAVKSIEGHEYIGKSELD